jgi:hypothetical protein
MPSTSDHPESTRFSERNAMSDIDLDTRMETYYFVLYEVGKIVMLCLAVIKLSELITQPGGILVFAIVLIALMLSYIVVIVWPTKQTDTTS